MGLPNEELLSSVFQLLQYSILWYQSQVLLGFLCHDFHEGIKKI